MTTRELAELSKDQLYRRARRADIEGRSRMDKEELVAALAEAGDGGADRQEEPAGDRPTTTKRSIWRGSVTFGLITIPVGLYTAVEDRDVSFRLLSAEGGSRIRYKRVSEATGEEVDWDDIVKGYEYEKDRFVTFTREELERIPSDSVRAIDVVQFTKAEQIDPLYFERSYYVGPEASGVKAYAVLVRALEQAGRVGLAKVTIREKERLCTLRPKDGVLVLETMNWPDEIRVPAFEELDRVREVDPREVEMAEMLIDGMAEDFRPERFRDSYRERLEEAIRAKIEGDEVRLAPTGAPEPERVTDLLDALRASVEATRRSA